MDRYPGAGAPTTEPVQYRAAAAAPSRAAIAGHPIHPMLIPFPIALLAAALVVDVLYLFYGNETLAQVALWLVGAGLATGLLAMVFGAVDFFLIGRARRSRAGRIHAIGNGVVLALAAVNLGVRLLLGVEESVVPYGIALSAVVAVLLVITGWYGGELSYRLLVGADPAGEADASHH